MGAKRLIEGLIQGEYWIMPDGDVDFADGDVGDANHEMIAMQHAMQMVRNEMALDDTDEGDSSEQLLNDIRAAYVEDSGETELDDYDVADLMAKEHHVDPGLLAVATGRQDSDPREYAIKKWGWHALRGTHVETKAITVEALTSIAKGIDNVLDQDGIDADEPLLDELEFNIAAYDGRRYIALTYRQLEQREFGDVAPTPVQPPPERIDQVRKLDQEQSPDVYKGNLGDSLQRQASQVVDRLLEFKVHRL